MEEDCKAEEEEEGAQEDEDDEHVEEDEINVDDLPQDVRYGALPNIDRAIPQYDSYNHSV